MKKLLFTLLICAMAIMAFAQDESNFTFNGRFDLDFMRSTHDYLNTNAVYPNSHSIMGNLQLDGKLKATKNLEFDATITVGNYWSYVDWGSFGGFDHSKRYQIEAIPFYLYGKYSDEKVGEVKLGRFGLENNQYVWSRWSQDDYFESPLEQNHTYNVNGIDYRNTIDKLDYELWYVMPQYGVFNDDILNLYNFNLGKIKDYYGAQVGYDFGLLKANALVGRANDDDVYETHTSIYGGGITVPVYDKTSAYANYYAHTNAGTVGDTGKLWNIGISTGYGKLGGFIEYIDVNEYYDAPGDWYFFGDTDIQGFRTMGNYRFDDKWNVFFHEHYGTQPVAHQIRNHHKIGVDYTFDPNNILTVWYRLRNIRKNGIHTNAHIFNVRYKHIFNDRIHGHIGYERMHDSIDVDGIDSETGDMVYGQITYTF